MENGGGDDMDSLFEGMVLFTPSQSLTDSSDQSKEVVETTRPPPIAFSTDSVISNRDVLSPSVSEPLDENLFSDLTIVTPDFQSQTLDESASAAATESAGNVEVHPVVSRQGSRKKKRASSLKIGYGRIDAAAVSFNSDDREIAVEHSELDSTEDAIQLASSEVSSDDTVGQTDPPRQPIVSFQSSTVAGETFAIPDQSSAVPVESNVISDTASSSPSNEEKFKAIKAQISLKLKGARELAAAVSAAKKEAIRKRRKAADDLNLASIKHRELEKQLEVACEEEDFETADRVSNSLAEVEEQKANLLSILRETELQCNAIDSKMHEALEQQITAEEECVLLLKWFSAGAAKDADLLLKAAECESSQALDKWFSANEDLEARKMELEIETHLINDARTSFNDSLDSLVDEDKREMEVLCKKKDALTDELEKLLALVKEKEKELAENDSKIKAVEDKIAGVLSGFQDMHSNIDVKYNKLRSSLLDLESESEALMMKKKEIDEFLSQEQGRGSQILELSRVSAYEAKTYTEELELRKRLMMNFRKSSEHRAALVKAEGQLAGDLLTLREEVSTARSSLQELSSAKSSIQQDISSSKQRIFFVDKRVPELEAEKKVAAAARNFKEAARIAAEGKALNLDKEDAEMKMKEATFELEKLEEQIKDTINKLQETEILISSKEKEVACARFKRLLLVAGSASAERAYALELGDAEEAAVLLAEAEAADAEAKVLQPIYDFKEDELTDIPKHFISIELVSKLHGTQLSKLAESVDFSDS
ncbi:hypothetical protein QQ045_015058 [Rhodiola kirilowii]